jgi:hypothetical protein
LIGLFTDGTRKLHAGFSTNLLDQFGTAFDGAPLIVAEGTAAEKRKAINRSPYLRFALEEFKKSKDPLVVFGHSLGDSDKHIVEAIRTWGLDAKLAVSMMPSTPDVILIEKARLQHELPSATIEFFDATTHPLGQLA